MILVVNISRILKKDMGGGYRYCPYEGVGTIGLYLGVVLIAFAILVGVMKSVRYFLKEESK